LSATPKPLPPTWWAMMRSSRSCITRSLRRHR